MYKIRLLERLSALEEPLLVAGRPVDRQLRDSIVVHLRKLLNTRAGSVPIDPNYGMPDMSNIAGSFAMGTTESLSESIIRQVARYEKRLLQPKITVEELSCWLKYISPVGQSAKGLILKCLIFIAYYDKTIKKLYVNASKKQCGDTKRQSDPRS